jgi:hypothetical protein
MRLHPLPLIVAGVLAASAAAEDFHWEGRLAGGKTVEIKGVNGGIEARAGSGDLVRVTAHKKARRSDPESVKVEVVEHDSGVTVCAVYPSQGQPNQCLPGKGGRLGAKDNDVEVRFIVEVPAGVRFAGRTVNGGIDAVGLGAEVEATTVNGGIHIETSGQAHCETVNGGVHATLGAATWKGPLDFKTVNGGITVELPKGAGATVSAKTVNGGIETDFPLTVKGQFGRRSVNGTIGSGGGELNLETVNGSIQLRQSS